MGTGSLSGVKRPERDIDNTLDLAPRLKKESSNTSTPTWAFVACSGVKFNFTSRAAKQVSFSAGPNISFALSFVRVIYAIVHKT
jgi:pyocin large subunit-like protein